jgi:hypothetical protein
MKFLKANHSKFPLSSEQQAVSDASLSGLSVAVDSCAGSGKSHTARAVAMNYNGPVNSIPFSAKGSDDEIARYAGFGNITALNFHKRGIRLCPASDVDTRKLHGIATKIDGENADAIAALAQHLKCEAYGIWENALTVEQIAIKYGIDEKFIPHAIECLKQSDAMTTVIDLDDMLRMPVITGRKQILDGLVVLDEVQDYTPASWMFLSRCLVTPQTQVLMIGDPSRQCLMAFAGANAGLFDIMADYFGCKRLKLTVNRRCSKAVVANAPHKGDMVALDDAPMGEVGTKNLSDIIEAVGRGEYSEAAILSEANAPLVSLGINLLTKGIPVQMRAGRLDKMIMRHAFKFLDTRKYPIGTIAENMRKESAEAEDGESLAERQDVTKCIEALELYCLSKQLVKPKFMKVGRGFRPINPIQQALEILVGSTKGITLLTGHTAKGLEWGTVFHLVGKMKAPEQDWQEAQGACLSHVIATRAKLNHYTLVDGSMEPTEDTYEGGEEE